MSEVFIYDDALSPISSSHIEIIENDFRGKMVDRQSNSAQSSGRYGAVMSPPSPMGPVGFWVDDVAGMYAPTGLEFFNPSTSLHLEVTLFPLPSPVSSGGGGGGGQGGGTAPGPDDTNDLALRYGGRWRIGRSDARFNNLHEGRSDSVNIVGRSGSWTDEEKRGVGVLIATIAMARMRLEPDFDFLNRLRRWESWLERLGVDERHSRGGQGSGGAMTPGPGSWRIDLPLPQINYGEDEMRRLPMEEER